jgi:hypothetical protein
MPYTVRHVASNGDVVFEPADDFMAAMFICSHIPEACSIHDEKGCEVLAFPAQDAPPDSLHRVIQSAVGR